MKALVGEWISNLAIISILAALVDMVLPNGNLRKYTSFLFGLVILIMFLQPLLQLMGQEPKLQYEVFQNSIKQQSQSTTWQKERLEKNQQLRLEQMMQDNLERELALELKYKTGLDNLKVAINFGQKNGETDFSDIQRVDVTALSKAQSSIIETVSIEIGESLNEKDKNRDESSNSSSTDMEVDLKEHISKLYNIEPSLIYINGK
ncbi:MAG: stage III sporulation protein AF [Clostridiales bacterium]|jgi:stage III sporulation protein AF|nr:stage III sporulation protein AF [Clostridiales bacterium]